MRNDLNIHKCGAFPSMLAILVLLSIVFSVRSQDRLGAGQGTAVKIFPQEEYSSMFGGKPCVLHYRVESAEPFEGRVGWILSIAQRTIARGETAVSVSSSEPQNVEITLDIPPVKDGVVMQASLSVDAYKSGEPATATHTKEVSIWSDDPFAGKTEWLKTLKIYLFDPEKTTTALFEANEIPFQGVYNMNALGGIDEGFLIIGEGVSFDDYRALAETLYAVAAAGIPVLCLAPVGGEFDMAGMGDNELAVPATIHLRRHDIIKQLDKRLDRVAWPNAGGIMSHSLNVTSGRGGRVVAVVGEGCEGWTWLETHFKNGIMVVCCFEVVKQWETGPTPRFLFARILEYMNKKKQKASEDAK